MRNTEREMTDIEFMHTVLRDAQEIYIAMNSAGAAPYVLPVNHIFHDGCIYFHCATEGRKLDLLRADPTVGFSTAVDIAVDGTTTRYRSVCGTGIAEVVEEGGMELKNTMLEIFAARFKAPCRFPVSPKILDRVNIMRIRIESLTGKWSRRSENK